MACFHLLPDGNGVMLAQCCLLFVFFNSEAGIIYAFYRGWWFTVFNRSLVAVSGFMWAIFSECMRQKMMEEARKRSKRDSYVYLADRATIKVGVALVVGVITFAYQTLLKFLFVLSVRSVRYKRAIRSWSGFFLKALFIIVTFVMTYTAVIVAIVVAVVALKDEEVAKTGEERKILIKHALVSYVFSIFYTAIQSWAEFWFMPLKPDWINFADIPTRRKCLKETRPIRYILDYNKYTLVA